MAAVTNWAGNITFATELVHRPTSIEQVQATVASSPSVRVLGTGHSFNRIADSSAALLSVADLPPVLDLDSDRAQVRISAGLRYGELTAFLDQNGFALPNLGSLPHISVAGACATGTHGSGDANGVLATSVRAQQLVTGDGDLVELTAADPQFAGSVVGLGSLGVVTGLTLALVPRFELRQYVYDGMTFDALAEHIDDIFAEAYSVSVFTRWTGDTAGEVWLKSRTERPGDDLFGARPADGPRHPIPGSDTSPATQQLGVPGPWRERLPHFRMEFTPSSGAEIQSEYFVAREHAVAAMTAIRSMAERLAPVLMVSEIRTIAADELWISPCYQQDRIAFHFTWHRDPDNVAAVVSELEARLAPFGAVPHWGKNFSVPPGRLAELHPRLGDFAALIRRFDPSETFVNDFIRRNVLG